MWQVVTLHWLDIARVGTDMYWNCITQLHYFMTHYICDQFIDKKYQTDNLVVGISLVRYTDVAVRITWLWCRGGYRNIHLRYKLGRKSPVFYIFFFFLRGDGCSCQSLSVSWAPHIYTISRVSSLHIVKGESSRQRQLAMHPWLYEDCLHVILWSKIVGH